MLESYDLIEKNKLFKIWETGNFVPIIILVLTILSISIFFEFLKNIENQKKLFHIFLTGSITVLLGFALFNVDQQYYLKKYNTNQKVEIDYNLFKKIKADKEYKESLRGETTESIIIFEKELEELFKK